MESNHHRARMLSSSLFIIGLATLGGGCDSLDLSSLTSQPDRTVLPATVVVDGSTDFDVEVLPGTDPNTWSFSLISKRPDRNSALHFEWDFGDGLVQTGNTLEHTFAEPGFYTVTVTALQSNDTVAFVLTLNVDIPDNIASASGLAADAGDDQTANVNTLVFLDGSQSLFSSTDNVDFLWRQIAGPPVLLSNSDQPIASFTAPSLSATDNLVFTLTLNSGDLTAEDTVVVTVVANDAPSVPTCKFGVTFDDGTQPTVAITGVRPLSVVAEATDSSGSPLDEGTLTWSFDDATEVGGVGVESVVNRTYSSVGVHTIALSLTVGGLTVGCQSLRTGASTETVTVWPAIAGTVVSSDNGAGISGVAVVASPGGTTSVTDGSGAFTVYVPYNWSGSIAPQHVSYTFSPSASVLSDVTDDVAAQSFVATDATTPPPTQPPTADCTIDADCDDSNPCTDDSCDAGGQCVNTADDSNTCDDGVFCNGDETCQSGTCVPGTAPCTGQLCNETLDTCGGCLVNADCDDGLFCNGSETCLAGNCASGVAPCPSKTCVEATDSCVSCLSNADCDDANPCTDDSCNLSGQCVNANDNSNTCDDGQFCNGVETCTAGVCVSSGNPCSGQTCSESTDTCVSGLVVSGHLQYFDAATAIGVSVVLTGSGSSSGTDFVATTNSSGDFQKTVPLGWSGTLTSDANYRFQPASIALTNLSASAPNQSFTAFRNYYVAKTGNDNSGGTFTAEFATIQRAAISVNPGDTVYVKAGTYNEWVKITRNGTSANRITFRNYQNDVVTIDGQGARAGCLTVGYHDRYTGGKYITVDGFRMTGTKNGTGAGDGGACALMWHSQYSEFKNLTTYRCGRAGPIVSGGMAAGIALRGKNQHCTVDSCHVYENYRSGLLVSQAGGSTSGAPTYITVTNCYVHDNTGDDEDSDGLWIAAGVGQDNHIQVTDCIVHGNADDGIDAPSSRGVLIAHNIVFEQGRNTVQGDGNGIKVSTSVGGAPNGGGNHIVRHNIVFSNARGGIDQDISPDAPHNFFYNNTIYGNDNHGLILDVGGGSNIDTAAVVVNNIMDHNNQSGGTFLDYRAGSGGCGGMSQGQTILDSNFNLVGDGCLHTNEGSNTITGSSQLTNPNAAIDASWQGSVQATMDHIRAQVYANFAPKAGSPVIDAGRDLNLGMTAVDDAAANSGSGSIPYFDIGAVERGGTP